MIGILLHGRRQLLHARGRFLQRRCLLFGALRQVGVAGCDLVRRRRDRFRTLADLAHRIREAALHPGHALDQLGHLVARRPAHFRREVALRQAAEMRQQTIHRLRDREMQADRAAEARGQPECDPRDRAHPHPAVIGLRGVVHVLAARGLVRIERVGRLRERDRQRRRDGHQQAVGFVAPPFADRIDHRLQRLPDQRLARGIEAARERAFVVAVRHRRVAAPRRVGLREIALGLLHEFRYVRRFRMQQRTVERGAHDRQVQARRGQRGLRGQLPRIGLVERTIRALHAREADQPRYDEQHGDEAERGENPRTDRETGKQGVQVHDGT